ncbi:YdcF family protein [Jingyaoa shaoxingensis]|uniref:YdcF family protein n=1 Tax=Jingyaoa shaoxingensis TaxID=2763671 RepID=A0ABR7N5V7_9FIRM|nr:YdcF family protein [Jingyaoa shaoxingensis]MBC8571773.1 YdcF family protein [Jingyaoa shaoxingensis]
MSGILFAAGSICLLYFLILVLKHVDFCVIWLFGAAVLYIWGGYLRYRSLHPDGFSVPVWMSVILGVVLAVGILSFSVTEGKIIHGMTSEPEEELDYLIVLGAQVKKTVPSKALGLRLQKACEYLKEHSQTKAVLSGGQGSGEEIAEAECMYRYLTEHGIPEERLLKEECSTTTRENLMYSARVLADSRQEVTTETVLGSKIGLVSNNFHIYRALLLAEKFGYRKVYGVPAASDWKLQIHYMVREYFAVLKAKIRGDI